MVGMVEALNVTRELLGYATSSLLYTPELSRDDQQPSRKG